MTTEMIEAMAGLKDSQTVAGAERLLRATEEALKKLARATFTTHFSSSPWREEWLSKRR